MSPAARFTCHEEMTSAGGGLISKSAGCRGWSLNTAHQLTLMTEGSLHSRYALFSQIDFSHDVFFCSGSSEYATSLDCSSVPRASGSKKSLVIFWVVSNSAEVSTGRQLCRYFSFRFWMVGIGREGADRICPDTLLGDEESSLLESIVKIKDILGFDLARIWLQNKKISWWQSIR